MLQELVSDLGPVRVKHRGQGVRVADIDAGGHQGSPSHEVVGDPVHGAPRSEGNWDDRAATGLLVNHQIVLIDFGRRALHPQRHDAVSDESQLGQCRVQCERQSPFIGHVTSSGQYGYRGGRRARGYREHRGGGRERRPAGGLAQEAVLGSRGPKR